VVTVTAVGQATITAALSASPDPSVVAGHPLVYTVGVTCNGPSKCTDAVVVHTVAAGVVLEFATVSGGGGSKGSCGQPGGPGTTTVRCGLDAVASGQTATVTVTVLVPVSASGTLSSDVSITSTEAATPATASKSTTVLAADSADLSVTVAEAAGVTDPLPSGSASVSYLVTVSNAGPTAAAAGSVQVDVELASEETFDSVTSVAPAGAASCSPVAGLVGVVRCTVSGALASAGSVGITLKANLSASAVGALETRAKVSAVGASAVPDPNAANDMDSEVTTVAEAASGADLVVTAGASSSVVSSGSSVTFNVTVRNAGPAAASNVRIVDSLPYGAVLVAPTSGSCGSPDSDGVVVCTIGQMTVGQTAQVQLSVSADVALTGSFLTNLAVAVADGGQQVTTSASSFEVTLVNVV
jgi:uncharacterized repeat protein (TIGR01451 family)